MGVGIMKSKKGARLRLPQQTSECLMVNDEQEKTERDHSEMDWPCTPHCAANRAVLEEY